MVYRINKILVSSLEMKEALAAVHSQLRKPLDSERIIISLFNDGGEGFRYFDFENGSEVKEWVHGGIDLEEEPHWERALKTGEPVIVQEIKEDSSWVYQKLFQEGIRSSILFPLAYKGKKIGIINFCSKEVAHFSEDHVRSLHQMDEGLAIFIQNVLLYEETRKKLDEMTLLYEMTRISTTSLSMDQMLTEIVKCLHHFLKFEALGIFLREESTKRFHLHPSSIGLQKEDVQTQELTLGKGIMGEVIEKGEALLVDDVRKHERNQRGAGEPLSEMCVPLKAGGRMIGVIYARSKRVKTFSKEDFRLMVMAGEHLAILIENVQSEERYRAVVESALDGVMVMGKDNRLTYANERLAKLIGTPREELIGVDFRDYLDEESKQIMARRNALDGEAEEGSSRYGLRIVRKDGERRDVEVNSTVILDSQGNMNTVVFLEDVTAKRKMEEQLRQAEKLRAVGEMAGGIAHDFNTALTIILGNTQLLLHGTRDEELTKTLKVIEKVAQDSSRTVRQLMEFTRNGIHPELLRTDINAVIRESVEMTKPKWKDAPHGNGVHIEMILELSEVPFVTGTGSEWREIIIHLIHNAIEAMPNGGRVEIRTYERGERVYIEVSDTGIGMIEEVKDRIFEPFFTTKPFRNTGLGLSMSYGMIKRFGGEIDVDTKWGEGTTFTISLPNLKH